MKGESVELAPDPSRAFSTSQRTLLAPPIELRIRRTVFPYGKLVQLAYIELYGKLEGKPSSIYTLPMLYGTQPRT